MTTQAERLIRIESPDGGRQYIVSEQTYKHNKLLGLGGQTYEDAGYTVVAYEDGTPYGEGTPGVYALDARASTPEIGASPQGEPESVLTAEAAPVDEVTAARSTMQATVTATATDTADDDDDS